MYEFSMTHRSPKVSGPRRIEFFTTVPAETITSPSALVWASSVPLIERLVGLGLLRLFDQPLDAVSVQLGDAELLRVRNPREEDLAVGTIAPELLDQRGDPVQDQVVPEVHDEGVLAQEALRDLDRVRE